MLSPGEIAQIKMEIERLEKLYKECHDEGMQKRITAWIEEEKQKLASASNPSCPICLKPCPPEDRITDTFGRTMHRKCYRASRISKHD
jgi:hypothetical protein